MAVLRLFGTPGHKKNMVVSREMGNAGADLLAPRSKISHFTNLSLGCLICQMGAKRDELLVQINVQ